MTKLPPLNAVRAFEAAARHGSFVRAGEELHVTSGAVSQQVKLLEAWLGQALFERLPRGLRLNRAGAAYLPSVQEALSQLAAASSALRNGDGGTALRIAALPAFAQKWLVPRLPRFHKARPEIEIALAADDRDLDLAKEPYDLWLAYGARVRPGQVSNPLLVDRLFPVCGPALAAELARPEDLLGQTLLHDVHWRETDWPLWLAAAGLPKEAATKGPSFTLYSMVIEAAVQGLGVAMAHGVLVEQELAAGELVVPFALEVDAPQAFHLISRSETSDDPQLEAFRSWLLAEAAKSGRPDEPAAC